MVCCVFHNFCQLMDLPKPMVQDVKKKKRILLWDFMANMFFLIKKEM
jgi:hypothetical protein